VGGVARGNTTEGCVALRTLSALGGTAVAGGENGAVGTHGPAVVGIDEGDSVEPHRSAGILGSPLTSTPHDLPGASGGDAGAKAQYKGTGTINGQGSYGFMLTAIDGQLNDGGGIDRFRMKIWNVTSGATVYDNQLGVSDTGDPTTALGGGSIVIHK
jgi:hypothetical protein